MITNRILILLLAVVFSAFALNGRAAAGTPAKAPEWAELFGGASLAVVWQSAAAASERIDAALAAQKLDGVADWAETIHLASHALQDQVKLDDPERSRRLKAAFSQAAKIADDVLDAASRKDADEAAAAQRRLKSALALAKIRMPKDILDAPKQEVRSAKSAAPAHDAKGGHVDKKK